MSMPLKLSSIAAMIVTLSGWVTLAHAGALAHDVQRVDASSADIIDRSGEVIGSVELRSAPTGVIVTISLRGLPEGKHGMHFHSVGSCSPELGFKDASGHIMPKNLPHGFLNARGPHAGNLPNLIVHEDGTAKVELFTNLLTLKSKADSELAALLDEDGSSLVIHINEDDHQSQPIGGSGPRIACAAIK